MKPKVVTEIPGPKSIKAYEMADIKTSAPYPIAKKAYGSWIEDLDGNTIYDMISGRCAVNVGHRHPTVIEAAKNQLDKVTHGTIEQLSQLEAMLSNRTQPKVDKKLICALSGSAANDAAIKLARWKTGKMGIIAFAGAYHGVTYGALSISSYQSGMYKGYGRLNDIFYFPYPDPFHSNLTDDNIIEMIEIALDTYMDPCEVAACIFEPVAGDAGWLVPSKDFVRRLYTLLRDNNILFFSEEVQTGFGRTGMYWGVDNYNVTPDAYILGKAMAGGAVAMAGLVAPKQLLEKDSMFYHGHTMGRHPVGVVSTIANMEVIDKEKLVERSKSLGEDVFAPTLKEWSDEGLIADFRGMGCLWGAELETKKQAEDTVMRAYKQGVYVIQMGYRNTGVLRLAPPLNTNEQDLIDALDIIHHSLKKVK